MNELDGCFHVYLDVGSNVGVQVRKLFESELYPDAPVLKVFDHYFGSPSEKGWQFELFKMVTSWNVVLEIRMIVGTRDNRAVCAVGFEPNPHHSKHLKVFLLRAEIRNILPFLVELLLVFRIVSLVLRIPDHLLHRNCSLTRIWHDWFLHRLRHEEQRVGRQYYSRKKETNKKIW